MIKIIKNIKSNTKSTARKLIGRPAAALTAAAPFTCHSATVRGIPDEVPELGPAGIEHHIQHPEFLTCITNFTAGILLGQLPTQIAEDAVPAGRAAAEEALRESGVEVGHWIFLVMCCTLDDNLHSTTPSGPRKWR